MRLVCKGCLCPWYRQDGSDRLNICNHQSSSKTPSNPIHHTQTWNTEHSCVLLTRTCISLLGHSFFYKQENIGGPEKKKADAALTLFVNGTVVGHFIKSNAYKHIIIPPKSYLWLARQTYTHTYRKNKTHAYDVFSLYHIQ